MCFCSNFGGVYWPGALHWRYKRTAASIGNRDLCALRGERHLLLPMFVSAFDEHHSRHRQRRRRRGVVDDIKAPGDDRERRMATPRADDDQRRQRPGMAI